jgi:hypothetical protein
LNDAAHSEPNVSARRASTALPFQNDAPLQVATFAWEALPLQFSDLHGSPHAAFNFQPTEQEHPNAAFNFQPTEQEHSSDDTVDSVDAYHKHEIIASINARVASERNHQQRLASLSLADTSEQGNQGSKVRRHLSIPGRLLEQAGSASRNQNRDSFSRSDFSRHLLGGSFANESAALNDHVSSRGRSRDSGIGRNVSNPSPVERSTGIVRCVATLANALMQNCVHPSHLMTAGKGIINQ